MPTTLHLPYSVNMTVGHCSTVRLKYGSYVCLLIIDSEMLFLCTGNFPLNVDLTLSPGVHTLRVIYIDTFGQTAEQTISFTVGKEPGMNHQLL